MLYNILNVYDKRTIDSSRTTGQEHPFYYRGRWSKTCHWSTVYATACLLTGVHDTEKKVENH